MSLPDFKPNTYWRVISLTDLGVSWFVHILDSAQTGLGKLLYQREVIQANESAWMLLQVETCVWREWDTTAHRAVPIRKVSWDLAIKLCLGTSD